MKHMTRMILFLMSVLILSGCTDGFPDEEMHFGIEDKIRPFAVYLVTPEAAPGQEVSGSIRFWAPQPDDVESIWKVALDYDLGLYGVDEVERHYQPVAVGPLEYNWLGYFYQQFTWTVPEDIMLTTSALPDVLTDPAMVMLAEELIGPAAGSPPRKAAVDSFLKELSADDIEAMPPMERAATLALADLFACQVRFRITLNDGQAVDVTRNMTIRQTSRLGGPNTNENSHINDFYVTALEKENATTEDFGDDSIIKHNYYFCENYDCFENYLYIPHHEDWTYFMTIRHSAQQYSSPFDPTVILNEDIERLWYYSREFEPNDGHHFFVTDDGDEAEMWNLNERVRIMPDGIHSKFIVTVVGYDNRSDWVMYHAVPGCRAISGIVHFSPYSEMP